MLQRYNSAQGEQLAGSATLHGTAASIMKSYLDGEMREEYLGDERMINKALIRTLYQNLVPKGFDVIWEQKDTMFPYTRLMEDFSFFRLPTKLN